jgi:hypothetical protein
MERGSLLVLGPGDQMILEGIEHMEELRDLRADAHRAAGMPLRGFRAV